MSRTVVLLLALASALLPLPLQGQGVRITGVSTIRYVDVRDMVTDSLPRSATVAEDGLLRRTADGTIVRCIPGENVCRFLRSGSRISSVPVTQDLEASAWGFGQGVRIYAQLRARTGLGEVETLWPQSDDELDLMAAYAELDRQRFRVRLGRQWATTGLGLYNFDGAALVLRPLGGLSIDAYGGWSLIRGVNEPHTSDLLESVEPFAPDERAYIFGGGFRYRPSPIGAIGAVYQREIRMDRASLYSERIAADGRLRYRDATLTGRLSYDLATAAVNEGRLRLDLPAPLSGVSPYVQYRHYRPFFELWTIWGAFSPVAYDEASAGASWRPPELDLALTVRGGYREYGDPEAGFALDPVRSDGWYLGGDATWRPARDWSVFGGYRADINFGAARSEGDLGVRRAFGDDGYAGFSAITFRNVQEFRVGESNVYGGGVEGGLRIGPDARIDGRLFIYRRSDEADTPTVDWTQVRGWVRVQWTVGRDPGLGDSGMP